jgi:hypothetical protein
MREHEVGGSEAAGKRAGSIILWLWLWNDQYILLFKIRTKNLVFALFDNECRSGIGKSRGEEWK